MSKPVNRDDLEKFHELDVHVPSRTILLFGEINAESAEKFIKSFHALQSASTAPITVILNSDGGDQDHGMAIHDTLASSSAHVTIKVTGNASSMGAVILQAADHRVVTPYSTVMFHLGETSTSSPSREAKNSAEYDLRYSAALDDIIYDRVNNSPTWKGGLSRAVFNKLNDESTYLRGLEVVEWGLADEVL